MTLENDVRVGPRVMARIETSCLLMMNTATDQPTTDTKPSRPKKLKHTRSFKWRGAVGALVFFPALALVTLSRPIAPNGTLLDWLFNSLGWIFLTLYATCRIWATLYVGGRKDRQMQTEGIYSATRNPLYLGSTCLALAVCFFLQSALLLALTLLVLTFYLQKVIRSEEAVLRHIFGSAFDEYARRTPRFLPRFSNYRRPDAVMVNFRELRTEARRLWGAALFPIAADLVETLRGNPNWPHPFHFL